MKPKHLRSEYKDWMEELKKNHSESVLHIIYMHANNISFCSYNSQWECVWMLVKWQLINSVKLKFCLWTQSELMWKVCVVSQRPETHKEPGLETVLTWFTMTADICRHFLAQTHGLWAAQTEPGVLFVWDWYLQRAAYHQTNNQSLYKIECICCCCCSVWTKVSRWSWLQSSEFVCFLH